jgi:hypothetical protein
MTDRHGKANRPHFCNCAANTPKNESVKQGSSNNNNSSRYNTTFWKFEAALTSEAERSERVSPFHQIHRQALLASVSVHAGIN